MSAPLPKQRQLTNAQIAERVEAAAAFVLVTIDEAGNVSVLTHGLEIEEVPELLRDTAMHMEGPDA